HALSLSSEPSGRVPSRDDAHDAAERVALTRRDDPLARAALEALAQARDRHVDALVVARGVVADDAPDALGERALRSGTERDHLVRRIEERARERRRAAGAGAGDGGDLLDRRPRRRVPGEEREEHATREDRIVGRARIATNELARASNDLVAPARESEGV